MNPTSATSRPDRFTDDALWQEEAGYSRAARRGGFIAVSGTTASAPDGRAELLGDTQAQTADAIDRCLRAVRALGGTVEDVVRTRVYLAPEADWHGAAQAHRDAFAAVAPANTMLHVAGMIGDGLLVEVELEALVLDGGTPA
ncbi:Rid family hydrolase [Nocardioides sp. CN2-186]|uniref:Rid family hydrolase n=1 Tax=Nocardioides tweenelious TaxID=3156607 RepID=UPI0032B521E5